MNSRLKKHPSKHLFSLFAQLRGNRVVKSLFSLTNSFSSLFRIIGIKVFVAGLFTVTSSMNKTPSLVSFYDNIATIDLYGFCSNLFLASSSQIALQERIISYCSETISAMVSKSSLFSIKAGPIE